MSYVCVPLYETLGENAIEFILQHAEVSLVFVEGSRMGRMVQALKEVQPLLAVVYWGPASTADVKVGRPSGGGAAGAFGFGRGLLPTLLRV